MRKLFLLFIVLLSSNLAFSEAFLGIQMFDSKIQDGIPIKHIIENSSAHIHGLMVNDIITEVDGIIPSKPADIVSYIKTKEWGQSIILKFKRNSKELMKVIVLGYKLNKTNYDVEIINKTDYTKWEFKSKYAQTSSLIYNLENEAIYYIVDNDTLNLKDEYSYETIDQKFLDVESKKLIVKNIKEKQAEKNYFAKRIFYTIEYKEVLKTQLNDSETTLFESLDLFPNPNNGVFKFNLQTSKKDEITVNWSIISVNGKIIETNKSTFIKNLTQNISMNLENGLYLLRIENGDDFIYKQFIVNR